MTGPLKPRWVSNNGPLSRNPVPGTDASTSGTETPDNSWTHGTATWKVKSDGTGGSSLCPNDAANWPRAGVRHPHVAKSSRSHECVPPLDKVRSKPVGLRFPALTSQFATNKTPAASAASSRHWIMDWEESLKGNMRPSASTLSLTP